MENFQFHIPTDIRFGRGQIETLPAVIQALGRRVLLVYGGGSVKRTGLYDMVKDLLRDREILELSGVAPNPRVDSVREGVRLCREGGVQVILAVGGGSVIDCAKAVAAAVYYDGDAWDMIASRAEIRRALPIVAIPTLAATGSEADGGAVISNPETREKLGLNSPLLFPAVALMDPARTFTVPADQTAAGAIDIFSHLLEQYLVSASTYLSDLLVESVMKTVIRYAPTALREPENYEARAQLMWAGVIADNATLCNGNHLVAFSCHGIEHELSAHYDVTHGVGLAIITPRFMRYVLSENTVDRFAHYGAAVWGIDPAADRYEAARQAIDATEAFFRSLGVPMSLGELGIDDTCFETMAAHAVEAEGLAWAWQPLTEKDVVNILRMCL